MTPSSIMQGFPPAPENQVTLANWRTRPYSAWAFHHVRELVPTASILAGTVRPLEPATAEIKGLRVPMPDGQERTVAEALATTQADGLVMLKGGKLVAEHYGNGYDGEHPHILFSVSKSITGLLFGILAERELLDPDGLVTDLIPELGASAYAGATIRQVLDMTVSVSFTEDYLDQQSDFSRYRRATGWNPPMAGLESGDLRSFLASIAPGVAPHGTAYHYNSPNSDLLGWLIERAAGRRYPDLLSELLWQPMGAERDADVTVDKLGAPRAGGGISATLRDLARLGELVRQGGAGPDGQVVPKAWVEDMFQGGDPAPWRAADEGMFPEGGYRSKWYQTGWGALMAIGIHGQWLQVDPESETVIAKVSSQDQPWDVQANAINVAMLRALAGHARSL